MLWLFELAPRNGIFNLGTGKARSFIDLASAVTARRAATCDHLARHAPRHPRPIPVFYRGAHGPPARPRFTAPFTSLEDGVAKAVKILSQPDPYR